jgi:putative pyruvate formate lyase activating enzyme
MRYTEYEECKLCPRKCGINRYEEMGYCKCTTNIKASRAALHYMEEPCISGKNGSGTIFFSGCSLGCIFCQNYKISRENFGIDISTEKLADIMLRLQDMGANNINLVTGSMYVPTILRCLDTVKNKLYIPIVYNTGGYETAENIQRLKGYVDIYLTDIKYFHSELSSRYLGAENDFKYASEAARLMIRQTGVPKFYEKAGEDEKMLKSGTIIRHLVMPGSRKDSMNILQWMADNLERNSYLISIMSQYTPVHSDLLNERDKESFSKINRLVTSFEYNSVVDKALELGIDLGYMQAKESHGRKYTPDFDLQGLD